MWNIHCFLFLSFKWYEIFAYVQLLYDYIFFKARLRLSFSSLQEQTLVTQTPVNMEELVKQQQIVLHVTAPLEELENSAKVANYGWRSSYA